MPEPPDESSFPAAPDAPDPAGGEGFPAQAFQALYRRFRPQTFAELRGQEHVSLALRNAVRQGKVAHAYLLSGPRGTGKTSSARILAKALNCAEPLDGEPCGRCPSCLAIAAGSSFDVHELDAASSNGVDAMRELVGRAALASPGRWKVYIVDEVHMLSTAASNALLKTLEEPPPHVVFVLATTEPQKVLATIRSRTQHYELHLLDDEVIDGLLGDVAARAGLDLPEGAIGLARRRAKGSARDALSALDQVAAAGVLDDDSESLAAIVAALSAQDTGAALGALDAAVRSGRDPDQVAVELVDRLRAGFLALVAPTHPAAGGVEHGEAEALGLARCVRTMEALGAALVAMRDAAEPRITLELALIRCSLPEADVNPAALVERLGRLERRVEELAAGAGSKAPRPAPAAPGSGAAAPAAPSPADAEGASRPALPPAVLSAASAGASLAAGGPSSRPALGSFRRRPAPGEGDVGDAGPAPAARPTAGAAAEPGAVPAPAATPGPSAAAAAAAPSPTEPAPAATTPGLPAAAPGVAPGRSAASPAHGAGPSRDDLVSAWGDQVLGSLPLKLRAYYAAGRFLAAEREPVTGACLAVFAVPNAAHVEKAEPLRAEVERVLGEHFGTPVRLRLVADGPEQRPVGASAGSQPLEEDLDEVAEQLCDEPPSQGEPPPSGLAWAEGRLRQAFPGVEEI